MRADINLRPGALGRRSLLLSALAPLALPARNTTDAPLPIADLGYRLVQDWSFGRGIDNLEQLRAHFHTRFIYEGGRLDALNDEWQRYRDHDNHEFAAGRLALVARVPGEMKKGQIESGMLRSRWSGQYGYFEGRMKVPAGRGLWSAFWLNPQDQIWPPEIDVVEVVDNGRDSTRNSFHILHGGRPTGGRASQTLLDKWQSYRPGLNYADAFHTFAALWEPGRVRHYVDDTLVVDRRYEWVHAGGADAGPAHLLVNLAVGGSWPGPPQAGTVFPARLEIEHLRVWQQVS